MKRSKSSAPRSIATLALSAIVAVSICVIVPGRVRAAMPEDPALLAATGYAIGHSLLVTHLAVGTLGDASTKNVYTTDEANDLINTYIRMSGGMKDQLLKLLAAGTLASDDAKMIQRSIEVTDLVIKESQNLKAFIASGTSANAEAYQSSRKQALKEIKSLLSIKD